MTKTIWILAIVVTVLLVAAAIGNTALAQGPPSQQGNQIDIIIGLLTNSIFGLEEIKNEVRTILTDVGIIKTDVGTVKTDVGLIKTETDKIQMVKDDVGTIKTETNKIQMVKDDVGTIKTETNKIQMVKDDVGMVKSNQYVPFVEVITPQADGFTCATVGQGFDSDQLRIDNTATSGNFVVTSILMLPFGVDELQDIIRIDSVRIQNAITNPLFKTLTQDLTGLVSTSPRAFDIMGVPLAANGNFPTQITAESAIAFSIGVAIFCNAGTTTDISFAVIQVSGWKQVGDTITLTYSEEPI